MKIYGLISVLLAIMVAVMAAPSPVNEDLPYESADEYVSLQGMEIEPERADRQRRVTCDLLSIKGVAEHSACAANCLSMGKAGGRCENGICLCRKTTFKELWDKRFG